MDSDSFYWGFSITIAIILNVYINKRKKRTEKNTHMCITCKSLVALSHKKIEKKIWHVFGYNISVGYTKWYYEKTFYIAENAATKKWMRLEKINFDLHFYNDTMLSSHNDISFLDWWVLIGFGSSCALVGIIWLLSCLLTSEKSRYVMCVWYELICT